MRLLTGSETMKQAATPLLGRVFVAMPFAKRFDALYEKAIRPAVMSAGLKVVRYHDVDGHGSVNARIARGIDGSGLMIAVVTGRNANVFYEIGFARASGKSILVIASAKEEIPAFLEDLPRITYGRSLTDLRKKLAAILQSRSAGGTGKSQAERATASAET